MAERFEYFLEFLPRIRSTIIDEMEPDDRCRFTRCSKQSEKEAKASKNFVYGLKISWDFSNVSIDVIYDRRSSVHECSMKYIERSGKKLKIYQNQDWETLWREELDASTNLVEYAIEDFKNRLGTFQKTIKKLIIIDETFSDRSNLLRNIVTGIESFSSLDELEIFSDLDFHQLFSKLTRPSNKLTVRTGGTSMNFEECEQVYQVREKLNLRHGNFNIEQLIKMPANNIRIPIGKMTERDVFTLIRSWQNGTVWEKNQVCQWDLGSNFNTHKLLRFLRSEFSEQEHFIGSIEIKHFNKPEKIAKLTFGIFTLIFYTR